MLFWDKLSIELEASDELEGAISVSSTTSSSILFNLDWNAVFTSLTGGSLFTLVSKNK